MAHYEYAVSHAVSPKSRRHLLLAPERLADALALWRCEIQVWRLAINRHARVSFYSVCN